jgi:hypothetical protein
MMYRRIMLACSWWLAWSVPSSAKYLRRQRHHLRPPPGHHRPAAAPRDPYQPPALIIIDLTHPQAFAHSASFDEQHHQR